MSTTLNPYGIRPAYSPQGMAACRTYPNGIASGYATGILKYQPVALNSSGQIIAATAGSADWIGVFAGVRYIDASGIPHVYDQWTAGTVYSSTTGNISAGYGIEVSIWDDPNMVFQIQADGSLAQSIGGQVNFSNIAAGSTTVGLSACTAQASSLTTSGQGQMRIVELALTPALNGTNLWGDAYTEIRVMNARSQYVANKVAV
jgi:hypothetical protein